MLAAASCTNQTHKSTEIHDTEVTEEEILEGEAEEPPSTATFRIADRYLITVMDELEPGQEYYKTVLITSLQSGNDLGKVVGESNGFYGGSDDFLCWYDKNNENFLLLKESDVFPKMLITAVQLRDDNMKRIGELGPMTIEHLGDLDNDGKLEVAGVEFGDPDQAGIDDLTIFEISDSIRVDEAARPALKKR